MGGKLRRDTGRHSRWRGEEAKCREKTGRGRSRDREGLPERWSMGGMAMGRGDPRAEVGFIMAIW